MPDRAAGVGLAKCRDHPLTNDSETVGLIPDFYAELRKTSSPPRTLARVQRAWLEKLRAEKGVAEACRLAGPFILSFQGRLE
jgi:hypothetical protein